MSRAPDRLRKTAGVGSALRALEASTPPYDVDAGLARFTAAIGTTAIGVGAATTAASTPGAAQGAASQVTLPSTTVAAAAKVTLGMKLAVGTVVLVGGVGTAALLHEDTSTGEGAGTAPLRVAPSSSASAPRATPALAVLPAAAPEPPLDPPRPAVPRAAVVEVQPPVAVPPVAVPPVAVPPGAVLRRRAHDEPARRRGAEVEPAPASAEPRSSPPPPEDLLRPEMQHLATLRQAVDAGTALQLASDGHAQFPGGVFWQEREAIAIVSLVRLGRAPEARARAGAFLARHPESPLADRLRPIAGDGPGAWAP